MSKEILNERAASDGRRIVLCDSERSFADRLSEHLLSSHALPCGTAVYSSREKLLAHCRPEETALLVIAQSQYDGTIPRAGFSRILILNEEEQYMEEDNISKYQAAENIAEAIRSRCASQEAVLAGTLRHSGPMKRIGVYSPLSRCLQTTFSICLGQILAQRAPALYLNFEAWSGLDRLLERTFRASVGDLLYYNACAREKAAAQISLMTEQIGGLHFLPPMDSFLQMRAVRGSEWIALFDTIEQVTEYAYLILDLTEHTDGLFEILRSCDVVYTIDREDGFSRAKMYRYEQMLREMNCEDILIRTRKFRMPVFRTLPSGLEMLSRGELAACVREVTGRDGL